jgi:hypothetical protein
MQILTFYYQIYISCPSLILSKPEIRLKSVEAMRRLYRMILQRSGMDSTGQIAPIRVSLTSSLLKELLIGQVLRNTRACK